MPHQTTRPRVRRCAGPGCFVLINRDWLMCRLCWPQLPAEIRRQITNNHRPARRHQSIRYHAAVRQAIDLLADARRRAS